jgi:hypothetical protein
MYGYEIGELLQAAFAALIVLSLAHLWRLVRE